MKLAFSTLSCPKLNENELVEACKTNGIPALEFRVDQENKFLGTDDLKKLKEIGDLFHKNSITVTNLASHICFFGYEEEKVEKAVYCGKMAEIIGTNAIRIFAGNFGSKNNRPREKLNYEGIIRSIQQACDSINTEVWFETHNEFATGAILKKLLRDVNRKNLKIIWDVMHPLEDGESVEDTWNYIGDHIAHIHIKDGKDRKDPIWHSWEYTAMGTGEIPVENVVKILEKNNFEGYLSLEWEAIWCAELQHFPEDINWILGEYKKHMNLYKGAE